MHEWLRAVKVVSCGFGGCAGPRDCRSAGTLLPYMLISGTLADGNNNSHSHRMTGANL
jgi:hypothetical protein